MKRVKEWTLATFLESIHVFMPEHETASTRETKESEESEA